MSKYTINKLLDEEILPDMTYDKLYNRIDKLRDELDEEITALGANKIVLNETGLSLLRRLLELEDEGMSMSGAIEEIKADMEQGVDEDVQEINKDRAEEIRKLRAEIKRKDERIEELENMVSWLQGRVEKAEQRIDHLLPGETTRDNIVERIRRYFTGDSR